VAGGEHQRTAGVLAGCTSSLPGFANWRYMLALYVPACTPRLQGWKLRLVWRTFYVCLLTFLSILMVSET
jgi:hypothetical protein